MPAIDVFLGVWAVGWLATTMYSTFITIRHYGWATGLTVGWWCMIVYIVLWPIDAMGVLDSN